MQRSIYIVIISYLFCCFYLSAAPRDLMLAKVYNDSINLSDYWVSEKYDGVRAYWDGEHLWSRQGNLINAPDYFVAGFPQQALDGELWQGHGLFADTSGIVRSKQDTGWQKLHFMVFDLPESPLIFDLRLAELKKLISKNSSPYIQLVEQFKVANHDDLAVLLRDKVKQGAEGLMLHKGDSVYQSKRTDDLLKLKQFLDAEAVVIAHLPGKGKYLGMLGALLVKNDAGVVFKIGSGFSDSERANPPAIGVQISYKYTGVTKSGLPRFPVFLRVRSDSDL